MANGPDTNAWWVQNHCDIEIPSMDNLGRDRIAFDFVRPIHRLDYERRVHVDCGIPYNRICFCTPHISPVSSGRNEKFFITMRFDSFAKNCFDKVFQRKRMKNLVNSQKWTKRKKGTIFTSSGTNTIVCDSKEKPVKSICWKKSLKFAHKNRFHTKSCYVVQREAQCLKQTYTGHFTIDVSTTATNSILITLLAFHLHQSGVWCSREEKKQQQQQWVCLLQINLSYPIRTKPKGYRCGELSLTSLCIALWWNCQTYANEIKMISSNLNSLFVFFITQFNIQFYSLLSLCSTSSSAWFCCGRFYHSDSILCVPFATA